MFKTFSLINSLCALPGVFTLHRSETSPPFKHFGMSNGVVIPGTPIAVDYWNLNKAPQAKIFLLTHCHADHVRGLSSTWRLPIYTSRINAQWASTKLKVKRSLFKEVEVGSTVEVAMGGDERVTITAVEANHIPGSIMFLLKGYFGTILYCGDTRYYPELVDQPGLCSLSPLELDVLYLDNTYCHPRHAFPSRLEAVHQIITVIREHPAHTIKLGCNRLGREEMFVCVALVIKERLLVNADTFETLQMLRVPDVFTTDAKEARIHLELLGRVTIKAHKAWNAIEPTISIAPSARLPPKSEDGFHRIPYSDHSSFKELRAMVVALQPRCLLPVVADTTIGEHLFADLLPSSAPHLCIKNKSFEYCSAPRSCIENADVVSFNIPRSVEEFMTRWNSAVQWRPTRGKVRRRVGELNPAKRARGVQFTPVPPEDTDDKSLPGRM